MRILVTRPAGDAAPLAARLEQAGHQVTLAPLMDIQIHQRETPDLSGCQAILFTSANGVRAFMACNKTEPPPLDLPVLAVGDATARTATLAGFRTVTAADGDVESLAALIIERLNPGKGTLFHAAGSVVAGDLGGLIAPHGFTLRRAILYDAAAVAVLPAPALRALRSGSLDAALFYSPRTARIFMTLADQSGCLETLAPLTAAALSPAVGKALLSGSSLLQSNPWQRIVTANEPTEEALLRALELAFSSRPSVGDRDT